VALDGLPPDDPALTIADGDAAKPGAGKALTIGAVCKALGQEFPDISISKIRYLEDQKLLTPRRTAGGYRLYSTEDVARLRTILRLQRDEFLPLRVIRQELARGRSASDDGPQPAATGPRAPRRSGVSVRDPGTWATLEEVVESTGATRQLVAELEEYGLVRGQARQGGKVYDDTDREIVRAGAELARYGVAGRNLRLFKTSADRESSLLTQLLAPSLRSRNPERRREAIDTLENLAAVASHLEHLLLVADLRRLVRSGS
jgi:DNA-binding transcriptional MerR regulator